MIKMANNEFLPLCDVLFNIISLLWYFCNVVFDLLFSYALYNQQKYLWFSASLSFIIFSLFISQIISLKCYFKSTECKFMLKSKYAYFKRCLILIIHLALCGVLWRYLKLFIPVDIRHVKHEVRDLCVLRLVHAFCEAAPLLLMQFYLLLKEAEGKEMGDLVLVSSMLSLFSMCWALASFSKNVRLQNVHKLVFTWLGVIFQLLWRLGTVGSRITALILYATLYGKWLFLVLGLHWMSMFLWLISPKNVFHGEKISMQKKLVFSVLIAFIYIFSYVNLQQVNNREKMFTFYTVMVLENFLLVAVWLEGVWPNFNVLVPILILISFTSGLSFMGLYYKIFHVRRLTSWSQKKRESSEHIATSMSQMNKPNPLSENSKQLNLNKILSQNLSINYHEKIPGVFSCRFSSPYANTAKRKKKKPTTFVPPPSVTILPTANNSDNLRNENENEKQNLKCDLFSKHAINNEKEKCILFWKRPLPKSSLSSSENEESSVGLRINIQHKLQEKKQKQMAELKVIEEEIKQGKIQRNVINMKEPHESSLQPIPKTKRHIESFMLNSAKPFSASLGGFTYQLLPSSFKWENSKFETPEIVLAPHFLDDNNWRKVNSRTFSISDDEKSGNESISNRMSKTTRSPRKLTFDANSEISLPRSYTLPKEFKYWKTKKNPKVQNFIRSNNSSDGDVDSADESTTQNSPVARRKFKQFQPRQVMHETKM